MKTKELTIEEKAKAYDRAIANAKEQAIDGYLDAVAVNDIFPELKEGEGEQHRKWILEYLYDGLRKSDEQFKDHFKTAIDWLEAQGEQKSTDKVEQPAEWSKEDERNFDIIYGIIYNSCIAEDASRLIEWLKSLKDSVQPQPNKEEWSEEDEESLLELSQCCDLNKTQVQWLLSLKDRVLPQPKQEWNEEDINMIDWLIRCCEKEHEELCNDKYGHQDIVSDLKRDCRKKWDWLESLKNRVATQKQWKPSEEMLEALYRAIPENVMEISEDEMLLDKLYQGLKYGRVLSNK